MRNHSKRARSARLAASVALLLPMAAAAADAVPATGAVVARGADIGPLVADPAITARGEYLVNSSGCHLCHTPKKMGSNGPEPDMTRMLSGHDGSTVLPPPPHCRRDHGRDSRPCPAPPGPVPGA